MKKETKKVILFFVVCIVNIVLFNYIFKWRRIISYREYEKSEKYYKEKIADVRINNMYFTFKQVREVEDVETCYEKTYHLLQEITIAEHQEYKDKLMNYAHLKLWINDFTDNETDLKKRSLGERCYLDANGNICGAAFSYSYRYKTINENLDDANIRVYITNEKLMNDGLPDVSLQKDKICNIYDYNRFDLVKHNRIFNSSKIVNGMELYQGNVCTAYFDGMKYYYFCDFIGGGSAEITNKINNYCNAIYNLLN